MDCDIKTIDLKLFGIGMFSECFAYWRAHELCDILSGFLDHIFHSSIKKPSERK